MPNVLRRRPGAEAEPVEELPPTDRRRDLPEPDPPEQDVDLPDRPRDDDRYEAL
jgi:hypothetical protein